MFKEDVDRGLRVMEYLDKEYGAEKMKFIWDRIHTGILDYTEEQMMEMGDKIALFNDWTTVEKLRKKGIK